MSGFDNAKIVKINNKEVDSIKTNDGGTIYQRPVIATVSGNSITLGYNNAQWLDTNGNVIIDWGDGTQSTVNNPTTGLSHTYTDGEQSHDITFIGVVTSLVGYCFYRCTGLTSVSIPNSVTNLGMSCFQNCTGLTNVSIPNSVTSLKGRCFYGCTGLTSVSIPNSVTSLGDYCFQNCTGLTSVSIPNSVTSLGDLCFYGCTGLTSVSIPNSVTSLGTRCFLSCNALIGYQLYWTGNSIIQYNSDSMSNNTNTKFYVPKNQKTNYINKGYPSDKVIERNS